MPRSLKFRLSTMMFLQYFVHGATLPILVLYLKTHLGFEPHQAGKVLAMLAVAAFFAPFITSHVADRFLASERLLAVCHLMCAGFMLLLTRQTGFRPFLVLYFLYGLHLLPTFGLTNAVALHHVSDAKRDFGGIRMWGTAGWVVVAWVFGYWWLRGGAADGSRLPHALYVSALSSFAFGLYSLTLPRSPVKIEDRSSLVYWKALKVFARPGLVLLCAITVAANMTHQFYYFGMGPFLSQGGLASQHIMPAMSLGQISEIFVLGVLGVVLTKLSIKQAMVIGLLAQAFRYCLFATGHPFGLVLFGITAHGVCYAFYFTSAYLYIEEHSSPETRAGAQQIFTIMIAGFGSLGGSLAAGYTAQYFTSEGGGAVDYHAYWLVPAMMALGAAAVMTLFFRETPAPRSLNCAQLR